MKTDNTRTVYKVLNNTKGNLESATEWIRTSPFKVSYSVTDITKPLVEGARLFVFDTLEHAIAFTKRPYQVNDHEQEVWEAEATNCQELKFILDFRVIGSLPKETFAEYWASKVPWATEPKSSLKETFKNFPLNSDSPPVGTLVCDSLVLTKKI